MELSKIVFCIEMGQPIPLERWDIISLLTKLDYLSSSKPVAGTIEGTFYSQAILHAVEKEFGIKAHTEKHKLSPPNLLLTCFNLDGTKTLLIRKPVSEALTSPSLYHRYLFGEDNKLLDFS